jgi:hypothetical protein
MDVGTMGSFIHHEWRRDGTKACSMIGENRQLVTNEPVEFEE